MSIPRGQRKDNDCGPACFRNAMSILYYNITLDKANELCKLTKEGTDSEDLAKAFDKFGFEIKEREIFSEKKAWNWLIQDTKKGLPVIISVDDDTHWVLVLNTGTQFAQIFDPSIGEPEKVKKTDLLNRWSFIGANYKYRTRFHGLKIIPYKDKSIRAVMMREKILKTIDIWEKI